MKLYTYFRASSPFRVRIALNLKGIDYEPVFVHLVKAEQRSEAYLAENPLGLVPTLVDGGETIIESTAIIEYLEETHPEPSLLPGTALDRARIREMAQLVACEMQPLNNLSVVRYVKDALGVDQEASDTWYRHWIARGFEALETLVGRYGGTDGYCYGDTITMADLYMIPQMYNAHRADCDVSGYPNLTRIEAKLYEHPAIDAARPENQPDAV